MCSQKYNKYFESRGRMYMEHEKEFWKAGNMLYPLPAVMVSCQRPEETPNIITVAWTGTICTNPAMVYISVRPERYSYDIIKETGEFVINLGNKALVKAVDYCGVKSGRDVDKFKEMKLTPVKGENVAAPYIAEAPVSIECKVEQILELGSHHMFIAKVVGVHVDKQYMDEKGKFNLNQADMIVYSHGEYYGLNEALGTFGYSIRKKPVEKKAEGKKQTEKIQIKKKPTEKKRGKKTLTKKTGKKK